MPLTEEIDFRATLQKGGRVQVPRMNRWYHRMEPDTIMKITVEPAGGYGEEEFLGRMSKDGRIAIPKRITKILEGDEPESLEGYIMEITLEPLRRRKEV